MTIRHRPIHGKLCLPWITLGLAAICLGLYAAFGGIPDLLVYDRAGIQAGQWWRAATGHLVHLDAHHLAYNIIAWIALGFLYETAGFGGPGKLALGVFGLGGMVVTAALFLGMPATLRYCGLSAILNALFAAITIGLWRETGQRYWLAALGLDAAKISWEATFGPIFSTGLAWPPVAGAHLAGFAAGCALATWDILTARAEEPGAGRGSARNRRAAIAEGTGKRRMTAPRHGEQFGVGIVCVCT